MTKASRVFEITKRLLRLPGDELALVEAMLDRLDLGRSSYGAWLASQESRDLARERLEELLDAAWYSATMDAMRRADE